MSEHKNDQSAAAGSTEPSTQPAGRQEQTDPQLTELRGFANPTDDLEPRLTDGTKAPDKAAEENQRER